MTPAVLRGLLGDLGSARGGEAVAASLCRLPGHPRPTRSPER